MQTTALPTKTHNQPQKRSPTLRFLNWLAELDANYRQSQKLKRLERKQLDDMGLLRREDEDAFYTKYGNRPADQQRIVLQTDSQW